MKKGFTLVEIIVIVAVLTIVGTISIFAFSQYRSRAYDAQGKSIASAIKAGIERYYSSNNEYPPAQTLFTTTGTTAPACGIAPDYNNIATKLNVNAAQMSSSPNKIETYAGSSCTWDQNKVYYLTKTNADGNATRSYTFGSCTYDLKDNPEGSAGASAIIAFFSRESSNWLVAKSNNGNVAPSASTPSCTFTTL